MMYGVHGRMAAHVFFFFFFFRIQNGKRWVPLPVKQDLTYGSVSSASVYQVIPLGSARSGRVSAIGTVLEFPGFARWRFGASYSL